MENLAHSLTAVALSGTGLGRRVPFGTTSIVVAANLPDLDSLSRFWGELYYLHHHRGLSHSILGLVLQALVFSLLLWLFKGRRLHHRFRSILFAVALSLGTHPVLDSLNAYGYRPFLPFNQNWYYGDLLFIVDPFLWLVLIGLAMLVSPKRSRTNRAWLGVTLITGLLVLWTPSFNPEVPWVPWVWIPLMAGLWMVQLKAPEDWRRRVAMASLLMLLLYPAALLALHKRVLSETVQGWPAGVEMAAVPRLADPFRWDLLGQDGRFVYSARVQVGQSHSPLVRKQPRGLDDPDVQVGLDTCAGRVMRQFSRFFFGQTGRPETRTITLTDPRFGVTSRFGSLKISLSGDGEDLSLPCPLP